MRSWYVYMWVFVCVCVCVFVCACVSRSGYRSLTLSCSLPSSQAFADALERDPHLSVALYAAGIAYYRAGLFDEAVSSFASAYDTMRGNVAIRYRQLGLAFTLYSCEVLHNRAVALAVCVCVCR